ncbi:MAG: sprT domain-containing protein [Crocinitomix sp.]|nr:sprT domain-containing protein [Crocinitomix sp.]
MVHFTVSKKRKTKLGDYRHPHNGKPHRISVNGDLNPYSFLITTLHEMAHLTTFEKYGNRVKPHGVHWKIEFKAIADPILNEIALPTDVNLALNNYLRNAKASSCSDDKLYRVLKRYDKYNGLTLEELESGSLFKLNGKTFVKGKKLRTRFECAEVSTHKKYRVLGLAEIEKIESN